MSLKPAVTQILPGTITPALLSFNVATVHDSDTDYTFTAADNQNTKCFLDSAHHINVTIPKASTLPGDKWSFDWVQGSDCILDFVLEDAVNDTLLFFSPTSSTAPTSGGNGTAGTVRLLFTINGNQRTWILSGGVG